jgi:uncharacterized protein
MSAAVAIQGSALPRGFTRAQIADCISPTIQELILLPTEKCNFRCTYCYEDFELGKMSEVTQRAIERFIERRVPELKELRLTWFGGEPLLATDVIVRIASFAHALCKSHGVKLLGSMTTNAYNLSIPVAKELLSYNHDFYQITLDGWEEVHDQTRRRADGKGTFGVIWNNLLGLRTLTEPFECLLRIHLAREKIPSLEQLMRECAKAFGADRRFRFDFEHLRDMGGAGGKSLKSPITLNEVPFYREQLLAIYRSALPPLAEMPAPLHVSSDAGESAGGRRQSELSSEAPYICYASRPNSLLIRSNGRIGKCTVALSDSRNDLGYLLDDGTVSLSNEKLQPWIRGLGSLDAKDAGCPISRMQASVPLAQPGHVAYGKVVPIHSVSY